MKLYCCLLLTAVACLCGCESMTERVRERFADVPPKTQVFATDVRTAYYGAQLAFKRLDFNLTRTRPGQVEASSSIRHSEAFADSRQLVANVMLREIEAGKIEVRMRLTEQVENASLGGPSERALREHGFYETYFATLQAVLNDGSAAVAAGNR